MPPNTNTEIELIKQAMQFSNKEISEIKKILLDFIDSAEHKFATKADHELNRIEIAGMKATHGKILSWIFGTAGTIFITLI